MCDDTYMKKFFAIILLLVVITFPLAVLAQNTPSETPWAWYISRAAGLVSFALLWFSIFLGISIRTPLLNRIIKPIYSRSVHQWVSLQALLFALLHGVALMFDATMHFSLLDIFVPFASSYQPALVALGTLAFYLMLLMIVTSYARDSLSQKTWRIVHTTNIILYAIGMIHSLYLGTDLQSGIARDIFIYTNAFLIFLFLANIEVRLMSYFKNKSSQAM